MNARKILSWIGLNLFVGLLYSLAAYLGLYLAVPPGYATPIFPSSGIALGAVLVWGPAVLPGVFLGSFVVNAYLSIQEHPILFSYAIGAVIGTGALLQAYFGFYIIRKWINLNNQLDLLNEILWFALLSGPVSSIVNATWSDAFLLLAGVSAKSNIFNNWLTWWMGDSIGILIFTPVFLILFAKPVNEWRKKIIPIVLPLLLSFGIVVAANITFHHTQLSHIQYISQLDLKKTIEKIYLWYAWSLLLSGMIFCVFINIILFIIYGQKNQIQKKVEEQTHTLNKLAHFDLLTALPNRLSFLEKLAESVYEAKKHHNSIAVCFVDIDNFKQVNDNFGHPTGDELLKKLAKLIRTKLHANDFMARLGGDEFGIIINDVYSKEHLENWLHGLIQFVNQPIQLNSFQVTRTISVGVALYPESSQIPDELLRIADIAMYRAKESGRNNFQIYNEEIHKLVHRRQQIDHYMFSAIENNEFYVLYQTQHDLQKNALVGIEALIYWDNDHLGGRVAPSEFISIAEENGLITQIGEWVFKKACEDFKLIQSEQTPDNLILSINLSVKQLEDRAFLKYANEIIKNLKIDKSTLFLEVTESALMKNLKKTVDVMQELKEDGFQFALDDFGTGYSSMEYLRNLPISVLKIDKSFIQDIFKDEKDEMIIRATIQLARGLNIKTIAEGVETPEQLHFLKAHGCDQGQGFYFSRPMTVEQLIKLYMKNKLN